MLFCGMLGKCPYSSHPNVECLLNKDTGGYRPLGEKDVNTLIKLSAKN